MDGTVKYARAASPVVAHFAEHLTAEALTLAYRKEKNLFSARVVQICRINMQL